MIWRGRFDDDALHRVAADSAAHADHPGDTAAGAGLADVLPAAARAAFERDGLIVLDGFMPRERCDAMRRHAFELVETLAAQARPDAAPSVFSTHDQRHARDAAFEASAHGIAAFHEEEAFDADGRLRVPPHEAVNKIGHALHVLDPLCRDFSHGPRLHALAGALGLHDALLVQSMLIFKPPRIGGEVGWHQDVSYLGTEPESVLGFWFALDDATRDNGCLAALPGRHREGLRERFARSADGRLALHTLDDRLHWDDANAEWIEAPAGTLIVFDGLLPHGSAPNRSERPRLAYTLHAVSAAAHWREDNWIRRDAPGAARWRGFV